MSAVNHSSGNALHEQSSGISYSSLFGFLTGVLQLLAFCFLPWLTTQVDCPAFCDGAARLQPPNPTGLTLAAGTVTTHEVVARINTFGASPPNMVSLHIPPLPESQLSLPFLWIFPIVSLLMLLISFTNLLSRGSRGLQGNVRNLLLGGALLMAVLVELFYMGSLSSAFFGTSDALAHMSFEAPDGSTNTLTLSTLPALGFWYTLLITLMGGAFILWDWWEERPANRMYSLWHLESVSRWGNSIRRTYLISPLTITRPRRGTSKTPLICPFCHQSYTLRVRNKQTLWLYRSLLTAGLIAFLFGIPAAEAAPDGYLFGIMFFCLLFGLFFLVMLDGISLGRFFDRSHRIRGGGGGKRPLSKGY